MLELIKRKINVGFKTDVVFNKTEDKFLRIFKK